MEHVDWIRYAAQVVLENGGPESTRITNNPHFETVPSWNAARAMLAFEPLEPKYTAGQRLQSISVHVRDHKLRELASADRTAEAHYGSFVFSQVRKTADEARRLALTVPYGRDGRDTQVAGCAARVYALGPELPPGDIDERSPSVVVWHDGEMLYLIASGEMSALELCRVAASVYE